MGSRSTRKKTDALARRMVSKSTESGGMQSKISLTKKKEGRNPAMVLDEGVETCQRKKTWRKTMV